MRCITLNRIYKDSIAPLRIGEGFAECATTTVLSVPRTHLRKPRVVSMSGGAGTPSHPEQLTLTTRYESRRPPSRTRTLVLAVGFAYRPP